MKEKNYRLTRFDSLSAQIVLWVGGCSLATFVVVFLSMQYYDLPCFPIVLAVISLLAYRRLLPAPPGSARRLCPTHGGRTS